MKNAGFPCRFCRGDAVVIAVMLAAALLCAALQLRAASAQGGRVRIVSESGTVSYPLSQDAEYSVDSGGYLLVIEVRNGGVRVASSDCPTQQCVMSRPIRLDGQCIVCLPAHAAVSIDGGETDADFILP